MTLLANIISEIRNNGQIPIDRYMELCNTHYYSTRDPLGVDGDFTTAPEICQVFGETIAIWAITKWEELGKPKDIAVLELGPGRGTLMADFLRAIKIVPEFQPEVHLVEMSPILQEKQQELLCHSEIASESPQKILKQVQDDEPAIKWHREPPTLNKPTILIANEFFDALPIKQFVAGTERMIVEDEGKLAFNMPAELVEERCPSANKIIQDLSENCAGGVIIDYGYTESKGDSFQAVSKHKFSHPLESPGEADLTAHVNFAELKKHCKKPCDIITQREFLLRYGGDIRAKALGVEQDFARLVNTHQMGELFKVLCF